MHELFNIITPPLLSGWTVFFLLLVSVFTCFLSTAAGIGGGVSLMAIMSIFFPPTVLIPVHGFIQIGSVVGRVAIMWRNVSWPVFYAFGLGGAIGAFSGAQLLVELPQESIQIAIGMFILWSVFGPLPVLREGSIFKIGISGAVTSALSLFIGVTGPIVSAIIKGMKYDRITHIATFSVCMFTQQTFKIVAFGFLGFSYYPYAPFIFAMIVFGFLGTYIGKKVLHRINEKTFKSILSIILSFLGIRLIISGLM